MYVLLTRNAFCFYSKACSKSRIAASRWTQGWIWTLPMEGSFSLPSSIIFVQKIWRKVHCVDCGTYRSSFRWWLRSPCFPCCFFLPLGRRRAKKWERRWPQWGRWAHCHQLWWTTTIMFSEFESFVVSRHFWANLVQNTISVWSQG